VRNLTISTSLILYARPPLRVSLLEAAAVIVLGLGGLRATALVYQLERLLEDTLLNVFDVIETALD